MSTLSSELWLNRHTVDADGGLQLLLMCCFLCTAGVDEIKGQQWQHGVHTLSRKQLELRCLVYR